MELVSRKPITATVGPWQAVYLHHLSFEVGGYDRLAFWVHAGEAAKTLAVRVTVNGTAQPLIPISPRAGA